MAISGKFCPHPLSLHAYTCIHIIPTMITPKVHVACYRQEVKIINIVELCQHYQIMQGFLKLIKSNM